MFIEPCPKMPHNLHTDYTNAHCDSVTLHWEVTPMDCSFETYVKYGTDRTNLSQESEHHTINAYDQALNRNYTYQEDLTGLKFYKTYYYCVIAKKGDHIVPTRVRMLGS